MEDSEECLYGILNMTNTLSNNLSHQITCASLHKVLLFFHRRVVLPDYDFTTFTYHDKPRLGRIRVKKGEITVGVTPVMGDIPPVPRVEAMLVP